MSIPNYLNRYLDPYSVKDVLNYYYPDYKSNHNEVLEELSKFYHHCDTYERVYDTDFVHNYFHLHWVDRYDYLINDEEVAIFNSDYETESESESEYDS